MLACLVVFCTVYSLILPAVTMEQQTFCGKEEHTHTEECYTRTEGGKAMVCSPETLEIHRHDQSCYDAEGTLIYGKADDVQHTHKESCYNAEETSSAPCRSTWEPPMSIPTAATVRFGAI